MTYDVYLQNNFVGTVSAKNTGDALSIVAKKIESGEYTVDKSQNANIKIVASV